MGPFTFLSFFFLFFLVSWQDIPMPTFCTLYSMLSDELIHGI
jgi:hypothetical protein